ncbi:hypothetical protein L4C38_20630 [Vibrio kasasachensis]|uniref:hypothetical protein n=1 Tax=Vibrio kasasachensis TaxID=2910248 RepID=UPI003D0CE891
MKLHFKPLVKCLATISLLISITACEPNPRDDNALFQTFIEENINKTSDDPYISSSVKPGDEMYEFLMELQHGAGYEHLLEPLIEAGNTDAMVWMARMSSNDVEMRGEVIALLGRAMEAGNPFAALALSDGGEECRWFGKGSLSTRVGQSIGIDIPEHIETCSAENWYRAQQGFKELAEKGDLRAQYYLLQRQHIDNPDETRESRDHHIREIIRFAEGNYYQPLMDYIQTLVVKESDWLNYIVKYKELDSMVINLLTIAANHNYIPAVNMLINMNYKTIRPDDNLFGKGILLGSPNSITSLSYLDYKKKYPLSPEDEYYLLNIYKHLTGETFVFDDVELDDDTKSKVDNKIKNTIDAMTPMVYIDGFTDRFYWVDR